MVAGDYPFPSVSNFEEMFHVAVDLPVEKGLSTRISTELRSVIVEMMKQNQQERLRFDAIPFHPYFKLWELTTNSTTNFDQKDQIKELVNQITVLKQQLEQANQQLQAQPIVTQQQQQQEQQQQQLQLQLQQQKEIEIQLRSQLVAEQDKIKMLESQLKQSKSNENKLQSEIETFSKQLSSQLSKIGELETQNQILQTQSKQLQLQINSFQNLQQKTVEQSKKTNVDDQKDSEIFALTQQINKLSLEKQNIETKFFQLKSRISHQIQQFKQNNQNNFTPNELKQLHIHSPTNNNNNNNNNNNSNNNNNNNNMTLSNEIDELSNELYNLIGQFGSLALTYRQILSSFSSDF